MEDMQPSLSLSNMEICSLGTALLICPNEKHVYFLLVNIESRHFPEP